MIALVASISSTVASALIPGLAISDRDVRRSVLDRALYIFACVSLPISVLGMCLSTNVVYLLAGEAFHLAAGTFALLSVPGAHLYQHAHAVRGAAAGKLEFVTRSMGVLAGNVILNVVLIPPLGAVGTSVSLIVSDYRIGSDVLGCGAVAVLLRAVEDSLETGCGRGRDGRDRLGDAGTPDGPSDWPNRGHHSCCTGWILWSAAAD